MFVLCRSKIKEKNTFFLVTSVGRIIVLLLLVGSSVNSWVGKCQHLIYALYVTICSQVCIYVRACLVMSGKVYHPSYRIFRHMHDTNVDYL